MIRPTTIGRDGELLEDEFDRQGIDPGDAEAALRQHGLERAGQLKLATLEEDGSISVVPAANDGASVQPARRHGLLPRVDGLRRRGDEPGRQAARLRPATSPD